MTAAFLTSKPGLRRMLVSRCPVLLIDESQDTNKALMDAFDEETTVSGRRHGQRVELAVEGALATLDDEP